MRRMFQTGLTLIAWGIAFCLVAALSAQEAKTEPKKTEGDKPAEKTPAVAAEKPQTGKFTLNFTERSELSEPAKIDQRCKIVVQGVRPDEMVYDISKEEFSLYVPETYDGTVEHGLFVWINSGVGGAVKEDYQKVLADRRMIWIGPSNVSNDRKPVNARVGLGLDAVVNMRKKYAIDENRIYAVGLSGGGSHASILAIYFPDVFSGFVTMCAPGPFYPGVVDFFYNEMRPAPQIHRAGTERLRLVMAAGQNDRNKDMNQECQARAQQEGYKALYLEQPGLGHEMLSGEFLGKSLDFLDAPLRQNLPKLYKQAQSAEAKKQLGEALNAYRGPALYAADAQAFPDALEKYRGLRTQWNADQAAIVAAIEAKDFREAQALLTAAGKTWGPFGAARIKDLRKLLTEAQRKK